MMKTPVQTNEIKTWHIDNLSDQFKVFIPIASRYAQKIMLPMNYIPTTHNSKNFTF